MKIYLANTFIMRNESVFQEIPNHLISYFYASNSDNSINKNFDAFFQKKETNNANNQSKEISKRSRKRKKRTS